MKWWKKSLIISVIWIVLVIGAGMLHTNVILAGKLTPQQDDELSGQYGMACGGGIGMIWVIGVLVLRKKDRDSRRDA